MHFYYNPLSTIHKSVIGGIREKETVRFCVESDANEVFMRLYADNEVIDRLMVKNGNCFSLCLSCGGCSSGNPFFEEKDSDMEHDQCLALRDRYLSVLYAGAAPESGGQYSGTGLWNRFCSLCGSALCLSKSEDFRFLIHILYCRSEQYRDIFDLYCN